MFFLVVFFLVGMCFEVRVVSILLVLCLVRLEYRLIL